MTALGGDWHWIEVPRPWWAFWREPKRVQCYCPLASLFDQEPAPESVGGGE